MPSAMNTPAPINAPQILVISFSVNIVSLLAFVSNGRDRRRRCNHRDTDQRPASPLSALPLVEADIAVIA
jgi:hypothetical protein